MATVKTPAEAWISAGLRALARGGPDAVRIEPIAADLGVSKGGFYWHFANRAAFIERMLDTWEKTVVEDVIAEIDSHGGAPRDRLRELFRMAQASTRSTDGLGVELAIRDWSRRDKAVAKRLRGIDDRRMAYMRSQFLEFSADDEDAEARALQVYALMVGGYFIASSNPDLPRAQVVRRALELLLA
ncbi:TetR/AcrR family transcriptional regulator [Aeromicrobium terrae]|uniref:TetR/AcrR family transcriptional regulator n=1 Tax=Aeromicrobium terrae TaxID=2498846 RepID=A0A5C8NKJ5_9ACTN|nr:TetR/AcrR family transcriptional regulator [Aeromicrobium terrae]TXL61351.1 TetR/AcrR family transcriptional regulator [Aeromicrobium terrae]